MTIVSIIKLLLFLVNSITEYARDKQLMDAGAAKSILKGLEDANAAIAKANAARADIDKLPVDKDSANRDN